MTWSRLLPLSSVPPLYVKKIADIMTEMSCRGLTLELWPHDGPVSFVTQKEFNDYLRGVQISFWEDDNGWFVSLVPLFLRIDLNKRKILRAPPSVIVTIVQKLYFPQPHAIKTNTTDKNFGELLKKIFILTWNSSYDLKPIHLVEETEMRPINFYVNPNFI